MSKYYTEERNALILIALLKEHGIKRVIASPGSTNISVVESLRYDDYFELFSAVDERSAAYMACGLAFETGEPVALSCTGATSARNYFPGLTEAYYRKLPVLAITSTQAVAKVGHLIAQVIDNSVIPNDVVKYSVTLPIVKDEDDFWDCEVKVNTALLELTRNGGGPVHINIPTTYNRSFQEKSLPKVRCIGRISPSSVFPELPIGKIAIFMGTVPKWSREESILIDKYCEINNAVVFCDHTSSYKGKFRVNMALVGGQKSYLRTNVTPDLTIYVGEMTGDYYSLALQGKEVWRVSEDGLIRDTFRSLKYVFEMSASYFFNHYSKNRKVVPNIYLDICNREIDRISNKIPELPFSNVWIASRLAPQIPEDSAIHFGILNSLRSWNFFKMSSSVTGISNVGGFGIDGNLSALVGASLANSKKIYYGVVGDLAFFYDLNSIGNRHVGNNLRILLVNNGKGTEFRLGVHPAFQNDQNADEFIAAAGHFGNKSNTLVRHYAENLGFEYLSASDKQQFEGVYKRFVASDITERPILFEVFTDGDDENEALEIILNLEQGIKANAKRIVRNTLGDGGVNFLKRVLK